MTTKKKRNFRPICLIRGHSSSSLYFGNSMFTLRSQRIDRSGTVSRHRRASSISQMLKLAGHNVGNVDSVSSANLMEIETRSQTQTPCGYSVGVRNCLKDVSNALTTSKELLKIIKRICANDDHSSSGMSLISALHAELERSRLQVNQVIQEQCSDQIEINYLIKCFAEEKAAWENKEQAAVEAAIESIAGELEVEKKLRQRFESLNKKLGKELVGTKASFKKAVKEAESEKRARKIMEQMCDDLAKDVNEDTAEVEGLKRESAKVYDEVVHLADELCEEGVQMKLSEAKHHFEEKNAFVNKLRNQLEAFLGAKGGKEEGYGSQNHGKDDAIAAFLDRTHSGSHQNDDDNGEVEDDVDCELEPVESDLHSSKLNMDNKKKWTNPYAVDCDLKRASVDDEMKGRNTTSGKAPRRRTTLQRSISDRVEWGFQTDGIQKSDGLDWDRFYELKEQAERKSYGDEMEKYNSVKSLKDSILSSARIGSVRDFGSPTRQWGQPWLL